MAKDTTVGARIDTELKEKAQETFDRMGLPMSLGIELFLRQVADTGKLPFALAADNATDSSEKKTQERDFWRSFICWNFDICPIFDSKEAEKQAQQTYDYEHNRPGSAIQKLIDLRDAATSDERYAAERDLSALLRLLSDAKELIYWALGMEKVFVPSLSAEYSNETDEWKLRHLQARSKGYYGFGLNDDANCITGIDDLDDEGLMDLYNEWVLESGANSEIESLLISASENVSDFEQIRGILKALNLLDAFEEYVEDVTQYC